MSLSLDAPLQRQVWEILSAVPARQRTEMVCCAILQYQDRRATAEMLREMLREELNGAYTVKHEESGAEREEKQDVEISDSVLDFLASL